MKLNEKFGQLADDAAIQRAIAALQTSGVEAVVVQSQEEAKRKFFEMLPAGAEVMNNSSVTLDTIGIAKEIVDSGRYDAVRNKLNKMDRATHNSQMQKLGAGPDWAVGSAHAVTEDGKVMIASNTGSQLSAYAGGASNVIWVVGAQKNVKDFEEGLKRIYEYSLPLERERAKKAYGIDSNVSKILVINKEVKPGRLSMIIVKEKLGF